MERRGRGSSREESVSLWRDIWIGCLPGSPDPTRDSYLVSVGSPPPLSCWLPNSSFFFFWCRERLFLNHSLPKAHLKPRLTIS
ncbi:hypothetical protein OPV22_019887 [Ensete ventricosum]|uniref:Uncharacterized protein n=1 Tax=Ensete ventricosum TaxID=4639 RepID=A0AAV8QF21_ENSVE|nr:hypothetical protein OPV22_019887 [Ensete ventricosum]